MVVRVAGGQAGYGDSLEPLGALLASGVDYLVCDALAESTLAVLSKDRRRDPSLGYTRDLVDYVAACLPWLRDGTTRLITNAGGLNPHAAGATLAKFLADKGVFGLKVAVVTGDEIQNRADQGVPEDAEFAVAYLGAQPIVEALESGAHIVISGRVADASLFVAPLVHEFGWSFDQYDLIAAGVTIGHLLECSAQVSGSVYSGHWWADPLPAEPGFPIADVEADGSAVITKPRGTGGQVNFDTVREQLLYEVHDPAAYANPDVTADFTTVSVEDLNGDRVRVSGATGTPPPETYKGLYAQSAGWANQFVQTFSWPDALQKAQMVSRVVRARADRLGVDVLDWHSEFFGAGAHHLDAAAGDLQSAFAAGWEPPEVVLRVVWACASFDDAARVGGRVGGTVPAMATPFGRPKQQRPTQLLHLTAFPADRAVVDAQVRVEYL